MDKKAAKGMVNAISSFRLLAGFFILYYAVSGRWLAASGLIVIGFLSDLIDGALARRCHVETRAGKILDATADIVFDELIICGLVLTKNISPWLAVLMAPIIVMMRLPALFGSSSICFRLGYIVSPIYFFCMIWLILTTYVLSALGSRTLSFILVFVFPLALCIIWLERERLKIEINRFKMALFS
jgi:phosphatidylglycerophosphate synthase